MDRETRRLLKQLETQGFSYRTTKNGHHVVYKDGERVTTISGTPSDWRAWKNTMSQLKRAGFIDK
ncbi:hypothetical protein [Streptomyces sp. t39]|uniref:hypothetical protein n=1 Tax=Streptomyces sp. t39 TaxID=1828156 RepID=UPI0011CE3FF5|nr:hypothetical protein [Streptomyces sp. t39]TXS50131.1 hypothetical protein EAO77_27875 [Streptomyces sp. t39]